MGLIKWQNGGPLYAIFYCRFLSVFVPKHCAKDPWKKSTYKNKKKGRLIPIHDAGWMEVTRVSRQ